MARDSSEFLDAEITGETEEYQPQVNKPHIPTYSHLEEHKKYGKYFRQGKPYQPWPAFLYHKDGREILVKNAKEAATYDVHFIKEESRLDCKGEWRQRPFGPSSMATGPGKTIVAKGGKEPSTAELVAAILAQQGRGAPIADITKDPAYAEFLEFQEFKKAKKPNPAELGDKEKRAALIKVAADNNITIDKRWNIDRIEEELNKHDPEKKVA